VTDPPLSAVCFDAYGTLCRVCDRRQPYLALFQQLGVNTGLAARVAMTSDVDLYGLARLLAPGSDVGPGPIVDELEAELRSFALFEEVPDCLLRLRRQGLRLWVASNLAPPYAAPLRAALAGLVDGFCLSFEVGAVKPEPAFFARLCALVGSSPERVLMVGDSVRSDVEGARACGMLAVHLVRGRGRVPPGAIASLSELTTGLEGRSGPAERGVP
jgi:FMN phosphatase YigB (HAD superfamily)